MTTTSQPTELAPPADVVPATDIPCPMCEYNLRGLTDPRCPECGYQFVWADLLDATLRSHPYLFEHHPKRNTWSFWKTASKHLTGPMRFWSTLKPSQVSRPRRLTLYFILCVLIVASPVIAEWLIVATNMAYDGTTSVRWGSSRAGSTFVGNLFAMDPAPWSLEFVRDLTRYDSAFTAALAVLIAAVMWPALTYASLLIFQQTMRRVRVKPIHARRCVVYSFDAFLWTAPLFLALGLLVVAGDGWQFRRAVADYTPLLLLAGEAILFTRLWAAYRLYMQFDRPLLTILASQLIVLMAALAILLTVAQWLHL